MDFALILFVLSIVSGVLWFYDVFKARKLRAPGTPDPWWVEYGASFFPVILPIFLLRSFWLEPFRIPSGSMIPTLQVGDFILVNKYAYGIRLPVLNKKIIEVGEPRRGDVMVFRYPHDMRQDYIKRVIGLPGDRVEYLNKRLLINGEAQPVTAAGDYLVPGSLDVFKRFGEKVGGRDYSVLNNPEAPAFVPDQLVIPHAFAGSCQNTREGTRCTVPPGHYFVMGDNRDQSADSRFWGFVPDENIVGRAFFIWFHADRILPPAGVDFGRIGSFQ
ncbi:MAG: signal peptidase I [Candidatus Dactylopiibacterium sp.]|nr:signal peptidase I [Candidatus Dactylopiibacterium sp.]